MAGHQLLLRLAPMNPIPPFGVSLVFPDQIRAKRDVFHRRNFPGFIHFEIFSAFSVTEPVARLAFSTESTLQIDSSAYQQEQSNPSASDSGTTKVKTTSGEQDEKKKHKQGRMHRQMGSHLVRSYRWGLSLLGLGLEIHLLEEFDIQRPVSQNKKPDLFRPGFLQTFSWIRTRSGHRHGCWQHSRCRRSSSAHRKRVRCCW